MSLGFCGFEWLEGREENYPVSTRRKFGCNYPARWAPLQIEGEFSALGIHSPSLDGVARSDGVVVPDFDLFPTLKKGGLGGDLIFS